MGWKFTAALPGLRPASFWGLRRPALQAGGNREPAPPAGVYLPGSSSDGGEGDGGWQSAGEGEDDEEGELLSSGGSPATVTDDDEEGGGGGGGGGGGIEAGSGASAGG